MRPTVAAMVVLSGLLVCELGGPATLWGQSPPAEKTTRSKLAAVSIEDAVALQRGALPILISAPHGGALDVQGVPARTGEGQEKGPSGFFAGRDTGTEELAYATATAVERRLGKRPYFVIAKYHRKYCDANRPIGVGTESQAGQSLYRQYRGTLDEYAREVQTTFGRGLLIDIHGQGSAKDTVFRGTKDGTTCKLLIDRFGIEAHQGPASFFGLLRSAGWTAKPDGDGKETAGFTGGNIVLSYGSHEKFGIDAIQLEFGSEFRSPERAPAVAETIAETIEQYSQLYLRLPK